MIGKAGIGHIREKKSQAGNGRLWACRQCYKKWAYNIYFRRCWCFHQQLNSALPMGKKSPVINTRVINDADE